MAVWDQVFPLVLVYVDGAPDPLVRQALCRAAREFCRRTRAWTEWLDADTADGTTPLEYDFPLPPDAEVVRVERATINGNPLAVHGFRQLEKDWTRHAPLDSGASVVSLDSVSFSVMGAASGDQIQMQASLMPKLSAKGLPDAFMNRYQEALADGAKSILLLTPGVFFNPEMGGMCKGLFDRAIDVAAVDECRSRTNSVPRSTVKWC